MQLSKPISIALGYSFLAFMLTPVAGAQSPSDDRSPSLRIEEVVVTARRRDESLQSVPVAVTALGEDDISRMNIKNLADIRNVPNVEIATSQLQPSGATFYIRGVGNKAQEPFIDTPVAVSVDGIYLATSTGALIDLFDIQQVEILRGPQGTLQGRNSPGGAVNVTTKRPDPNGEFNVTGEVGYGRFDSYDIKLAAGAPLINDVLAVRTSLLVTESDGHKDNLFDGESLGGRTIYSARSSLMYTPNENFDLFLSADYSVNRSDPTGTRSANSSVSYPRQPVSVACSMLGFCEPVGKWDVDTDFNNTYKLDSGGLSATANMRLEDTVITSVTGYRKLKEKQNVDVDGLPIAFIHVVDGRLELDQFSQEVRWASDNQGVAGKGQFDWVVGGIYFESEYDLSQPVAVFGETTTLLGHQELESYALFGQATYYTTDAWSISAGLRQTWDRKRYDGVQAGFTEADRAYVSKRWDNFSFELGTEYRISDDHLVYARFAQGYRAGGISGGANTPETVLPFDPETVDSWELGAKTEWFESRVIANLALFFNDYKDMQHNVTLPSEFGFAPVIRNAANAEIKGLELEVIARPTSQLTTRLSYGYMDSEYKDFFSDLVGSGEPVDNTDLRLPFAPKNTVSVSVDYHIPLASGDEITLFASATKKSRHTVLPLDLPVAAEDGSTITDISVRYDLANGNLGFELYGLNIFDQHYIVAGEIIGGATHYQIDGHRRTYGGRVFFNF